MKSAHQKPLTQNKTLVLIKGEFTFIMEHHGTKGKLIAEITTLTTKLLQDKMNISPQATVKITSILVE